MPLYNYTVNIHKLEDGTKCHTFRLPRKDGRLTRPGQTAFHWVRSRQPDRRKIGENHIHAVMPMIVREYGLLLRNQDALAYIEWQAKFYNRVIDWEVIYTAEADNLTLYPVRSALTEIIAINDGFEDWSEMLIWAKATHGKNNPESLNLFGLLACWNPNTQTKLPL